MSLLAIVAALVIEQWRPLGDRRYVQGTLAALAQWLEQSFNGGERRHGIVAWLVAVVPAVLAVALVHSMLRSVSPLLALVFNVAVLYLTLGHCRGHYDMQPMIEYYPQVERCAWNLPVFYDLLRRGIAWAKVRA